jgi:hypothetical protein
MLTLPTGQQSAEALVAVIAKVVERGIHSPMITRAAREWISGCCAYTQAIRKGPGGLR